MSKGQKEQGGADPAVEAIRTMFGEFAAGLAAEEATATKTDQCYLVGRMEELAKLNGEVRYSNFTHLNNPNPANTVNSLAKSSDFFASFCYFWHHCSFARLKC